jgi:tetratricopeptide (TPR) repeat protein
MRLIITITLFLLLTTLAQAQTNPYDGWLVPRESPPASVSQVIGVTEVTIKYDRPAVKGREIWGKLVPYDKVWRAGANEATTITFSTDVKIEGQPLRAGSYALFMIPTPTEWAIIFSKAPKQWGAFTYQETQDALRVKVKPLTTELQERLLYNFPIVAADSAQVALHWEKLKVPFNVTVDTVAQTMARVKRGFYWQAGWFAANYFYQNKQLDEALKWANAAIALEESAGNHILKAKILAELKHYDEAIQTAERAVTLAEKLPNAAQVKESYGKLIAEWKRLKG